MGVLADTAAAPSSTGTGRPAANAGWDTGSAAAAVNEHDKPVVLVPSLSQPAGDFDHVERIGPGRAFAGMLNSCSATPSARRGRPAKVDQHLPPPRFAPAEPGHARQAKCPERAQESLLAMIEMWLWARLTARFGPPSDHRCNRPVLQRGPSFSIGSGINGIRRLTTEKSAASNSPQVME